MSDWKPYQLLGRKRLASIAAQVQTMLPAFARDWWRDGTAVELIGVRAWSGCADSDHAGLNAGASRGNASEPNREQSGAAAVSSGVPRASSIRYLVRDGDLWLAFMGQESIWRKLAESWLGCEVLLDSALTRSLQREFCLALFAGLAGREGATASLADEELPHIPPGALRPGAGTVVVEIDVDGVPLTLLAPIELWPAVSMPAVGAARSKLTPAAHALAESTIKLDVQLGAVRMPLTELATLRAGDFLDLAHDLSGRVHVTGAGVDLSLSAAIGQHHGCKAICMEANERAGE